MIVNKQNYSKHVTRDSQSLDLDPGVFTWDDPHRIAVSLKISAELNERQKGTTRHAATSVLTRYMDRGGQNITSRQKQILEQAKTELQKLFVG